MAQLGRDVDGENAVDLVGILVGRDVLGDLAVVDEGLVEPRGLAAGEHVGEQIEIGVTGLIHRGDGQLTLKRANSTRSSASMRFTPSTVGIDCAMRSMGSTAGQRAKYLPPTLSPAQD